MQLSSWQVWIAGSAITFWTTNIQEVVNSFTYGGSFLTSYPINIFGAWTHRFLAFVIPMAFVAYYPSLFILDKPDAVMGPPSLAFASPLVALLTLTAGAMIWRSGVRHYRSTGSGSKSPTCERRSRRTAAPAGCGGDASASSLWTASASRSQAGEMVGYIGPNGAGKSTTIKMLTGTLVPSSGWVRVAGLDPARRRTGLARRIGVVFGNRSLLWWDLPLRDSFELLRHIYSVPHGAYHRRLSELRELLELEPFLETPVRQLSLGQRMRGELTAALLHGPEVVFLDEPTVGLDIVSKARVRDFLEDLNRQRGVTVLLTTHDLSDIERLCPRMLIVDHGRVLYDGGTAEIAARFGAERTLVVDLTETRPALHLAHASVVRTDGRGSGSASGPRRPPPRR